MTDVLGPANAANAVTTRIAESRVFPTGDTWFKPCSTPASQDGTQIQSVFLNGLMAQLRAAIRGNGKKNDGVTPIIAEDNTNDALLLGAILQLIQRGQANYVADTGTADALVVAPSPALAEYEVGLRLLVLKNPIVNANATTTPKLNAGLGQVTIVKNDGSPLGIGDLKKGGVFEVEFDGTSARLTAPVVPSDFPVILVPYIRPRLTGNLNLYVAPSTSTPPGNDSNPGTQAAPFLTLQAAANYAKSVDTNGYQITVNAANGTYAGPGMILAAPLIGGGSLTFKGNSASPASVTVNNTASTGNTACFDATGGAQIIVDGFTLMSTNGPALFAQGAGSVISYQNIIFSNCITNYHVYAFGGGQCLAQAGTCTIVGNALSHLYSVQGGTIYNNGLTAITVSGNITFSGSAFAAASLLASIVFTGCTITVSGACTGTRYTVGANSLIYTGGGGANYFPGTVAGITGGGGYYG